MSGKNVVKLRVLTLTCGACVRAVTDAVNGLGAGVETVIDLADKSMVVKGPSNIVSEKSVKDVVSSIGHEATDFKASNCCSKGKGPCKAKALGTCTCGDNCQCGDDCNCSGCGNCSTKGKGPCKAKALGTCTCGDNCQCGDSCQCSGCGRVGPNISRGTERVLLLVSGMVLGILIQKLRSNNN